jgi:glutamyl-tRNA reductase
LATITGGRAIHFDDWAEEVRDLDIVVSATAAPHVVITLDKLAPFMRARRHRPLLMIDLAMPRDIDPAVQQLDGVYLYDLDSLQSIAERTLAVREQVSAKCCQLIEHHVQDFKLWIERSQSSNFCSIADRRFLASKLDAMLPVTGSARAPLLVCMDPVGGSD